MLIETPVATEDFTNIAAPVTPAEKSVAPVPSSAADPDGEPRWLRIGLLCLALPAVFLFFAHARAYWVGAHPGVDQNGYLLGGKLFAETLTMKFAPVLPGTRAAFDPHQYVGNMWVGTNYGTADEAYYPKYPLGMPLLVATSLWIGGDTCGPIIAYWINPVAMTLAVLATFLLARELVGSIYALLAAVVFATSPVTLGLTTNPNSHATAVCCVTWGMYLLYRWWKKGGAFRASFAGLLIGYAATIRYTEGALILPIAFAIITTLASARRWRTLKAWRDCGWLLFGWAVPVAGLVSYNLAAMGTVTGYDPTNESTGFSWEFVRDNWETLLRHLNTNGVAFLLPVAIAGLIWMYRRNWRDATWLTLWILPCMATYVAYYWAPDAQQVNQLVGISYLRFFLTILPALSLAAFWGLRQLVRLIPEHDRGARAWAVAGVGLLTAAVILVQFKGNAEPMLQQDQLTRLNLKVSSDEVLAVAPAGSVIFVNDAPLLNHLQFVGDYTMYSGNNFDKGYVDRLAQTGLTADDPQAWDPARREALYARLKGLTQAQLDDSERNVIQRALDADLRVFVIVPRRANDPFVGRRRRDGAVRGNVRNRSVPDALSRVLQGDRFDTEIVASWNHIVPWTQEISRTRGQRPRAFVGPAARAPAAATAYQVVEITKKVAEPSKPPTPPAPTSPRPPRADHPRPQPTSKPATTRTALVPSP
jgi:4-amino-4-deoxy-L-arabinose transferase-like glycosyltransferase